MVNNIVKLISKGGADEKWAENTIDNYGSVVSRILAILLKDKSPEDIKQLLRDNRYETQGDPTTVANNIKLWLGVNE